MTTQPTDGLDILRKMRAGVSMEFEISAREFKVMVRPLSANEMIGIAKSVSRLMMENGKKPIEESVANAAYILEKAATPIGEKVSRLPAAVIELMLPDEIDHLYGQWLAGVEKLNPSIEDMPLDQVRALVEEVKKSPLGIASALNSLSFRALVNISRHLIQKG